MTAYSPLIRDTDGKIKELGASDTILGAPAGTNGTNGMDGGAISIRYTFDTTTTDSDPGSGKLRLDNATQNSATKIYLDLEDNIGSDWTSVIDTFDDSTNTNKADIRLVKVSDATKWLTFTLTAWTTATGYRKLTITNTGSSASSPFSNGDSILLCWTRAGDKGEAGTNGTNGTGWTVISHVVTSSSQATVDFTSIPGSYKHLKIIWSARDTTSGTSASVLRCKINNDGTSGNYTTTSRSLSDNGSHFASGQTSSSAGCLAGEMPNDGNTAGKCGGGEITFPDYAGTTFNKRINGLYSGITSNANGFVAMTGASWISTAAITRITLGAGTAFKDGSTFTLCGIS